METDREDRIEAYYHQSARDLAEWLVDAEDEIETWKAKVVTLNRALDRLVNERLKGG